MVFYTILAVALVIAIIVAKNEYREKISVFILVMLIGAIVAFIVGGIVSMSSASEKMYENRGVESAIYYSNLDKYVVTDDDGFTYEVTNQAHSTSSEPRLKFYVVDDTSGIGLPWRFYGSEKIVLEIAPEDIVVK